MGDFVSSVFDVATLGLFREEPEEEVLPPSDEETQAQKDQRELLEAREREAARQSGARQKVITARSAGAQTLFKREGAIPRATRLGGGRKS